VPTYFASDVAYHTYKYDQGYDEIIDVFGADHHGYLPRIKAFLQGMGKDTDKLRILLVQFAILYRGTERVQMSTRSGEFVTLRELRDEVGNDAARFFYIMRKPEQHLDFDLELAKSTSNENPVYYIQYAHARICSVWRQLAEQKLTWDKDAGLTQLNLLSHEDEKNLIAAIASYPELIASAAQQYAPHRLAHYLQTTAQYFHTYYNAHKFIVDDAALRNARLCLVASAQQVFKNGLTLLGVSSPEKM
jgi:arginyl-tRNA synthetase